MQKFIIVHAAHLHAVVVAEIRDAHSGNLLGFLMRVTDKAPLRPVTDAEAKAFLASPDRGRLEYFSDKPFESQAQLSAHIAESTRFLEPY